MSRLMIIVKEYHEMLITFFPHSLDILHDWESDIVLKAHKVLVGKV